MQPSSRSIIVQPGAGKDLYAFRNTLSVMLNGEQTGGAFSVMSELTRLGAGHRSTCTAARMSCFSSSKGESATSRRGIGARWGGGLVYLPKGVEHCYRNVGTTPSRHWIITRPSGFEDFFARCADEFAQTGGPEMNRIVEIHREHGIDLIDEGNSAPT